MEFFVKIWNNYDEIVAAAGGVLGGKLMRKWLDKMFPRWNGQLAKFMKSGVLLTAGLGLFQYGKENKISNIQYAGAGIGVEAISNLIEALSNESLDGIAEGTVSMFTGSGTAANSAINATTMNAPTPIGVMSPPGFDDYDDEEEDYEDTTSEIKNAIDTPQYDDNEIEEVEYVEVF